MHLMRIPFFFLVSVLLATIGITACAKEETTVTSEDASDFQHVALIFTQALAARDYDAAYAMTSHQYRSQAGVAQLRADFEAIVPLDWGPMDPIAVGEIMTSWPGKLPSDLGWAYVIIGGDVYSEAVTVVVSLEQGEARIRDVEFGRP